MQYPEICECENKIHYIRLKSAYRSDKIVASALDFVRRSH